MQPSSLFLGSPSLRPPSRNTPNVLQRSIVMARPPTVTPSTGGSDMVDSYMQDSFDTKRVLDFSTQPRNVKPRTKPRKRQAKGKYKTKSNYRSKRPAMSKRHFMHARGFVNPFAPGNPKILDKIGQPSLGLKLRKVLLVSCEANKRVGIWYGPSCGGNIIIFPDLDAVTPDAKQPINPITFISDKCGLETNGTTGAENGFEIVFMRFGDTSTTGADSPTPNIVSGGVRRAGGVALWRFVSGGFNCMPINNIDKNGGYWEAFHTNARPSNVGDVILYEGEKDVYDIINYGKKTSCAFLPTQKWITELAQDLSSDVSTTGYCAGHTLGLGKRNFTCKPISNIHAFKTIPEAQQLQMGQGGNTLGVAPLASALANEKTRRGVMYVDNGRFISDQNRVYEKMYDETFNNTLLVINNGSDAQTFKVDVTTNLEVVYDLESELSNFHQDKEVNVKVADALHDMAKDGAAGQMVTTA